MSLCFRLSHDSNFARNVGGVLVESVSASQNKLKGKKMHLLTCYLILRRVSISPRSY